MLQAIWGALEGEKLRQEMLKVEMGWDSACQAVCHSWMFSPSRNDACRFLCSSHPVNDYVPVRICALVQNRGDEYLVSERTDHLRVSFMVGHQVVMDGQLHR